VSVATHPALRNPESVPLVGAWHVPDSARKRATLAGHSIQRPRRLARSGVWGLWGPLSRCLARASQCTVVHGRCQSPIDRPSGRLSSVSACYHHCPARLNTVRRHFMNETTFVRQKGRGAACRPAQAYPPPNKLARRRGLTWTTQRRLYRRFHTTNCFAS
jgi:hypothetical protein